VRAAVVCALTFGPSEWDLESLTAMPTRCGIVPTHPSPRSPISLLTRQLTACGLADVAGVMCGEAATQAQILDLGEGLFLQVYGQ